MRIRLNDEIMDYQGAANLESLLQAQGWSLVKGLAVAVNETVIPKSLWSQTALADGDALLVLHATQGG
jgi:sulfur carrier protein